MFLHLSSAVLRAGRQAGRVGAGSRGVQVCKVIPVVAVTCVPQWWQSLAFQTQTYLIINCIHPTTLYPHPPDTTS